MQEVELETPNPALVVTYRDLSSIHNSGFIHEANSNPHSSTGHQRFVPGPSLRARHVEDGQHRSTQRMTNPNSCPFGLAMGVFSQSCMPKLGVPVSRQRWVALCWGRSLLLHVGAACLGPIFITEHQCVGVILNCIVTKLL